MSEQTSFVTAAEAGIPEIEQMKIALELILSQGGIAVMQQIYEAVETRMGEDVYLSQQGKNSLRRVINTRAVEIEYIHPYDRNDPGWQITEKGIAFIREELGRHIGEVRVTARAAVSFHLAMKEIRDLLGFYDDVRQAPDQSNRSLDVFKRTGIILIVTAWESFIEDIFKLSITQKIDTASSPNDLQRAFNTIAQIWYDAILNKQNQHPKPDDFVKWAGDNWKKLIREKLQDDLASLNTPKSRNVGDLSKRYLGTDITENWSWAGMSAQRACTKLDELIELRGELAHRIGNFFEGQSSVRRDHSANSVDSIEKLALRTQEIIDNL